MSINKLVSIKRAVAQAQDNMGIEEDNLYPVMKVWAAEAEHRIDSFHQYIPKIFVLKVNNCCVDIPCEAVAVLGVLLGDHGCECDLAFEQLYMSAYNAAGVMTYGFVVVDNGSGVCSDQSADYDIFDNKIVFKRKPKVDFVTVKFFIQKMDNDGWMLVGENHTYAIAAFIEYMWMKRSRHRINGVRYTQGEIDSQFREWSRLAAHAAVEDDKPTPEQENRISQAFNDPISGYGAALWLYRNSYYGVRTVV